MANLKPCKFIVTKGGEERSLTYDEMRQYLFDNPKLWADVSTRRKGEIGKGQARISGLSVATEQQLAGEKEVEALKRGEMITTTHPIRLLKGIYGKRNADGSIRSAHTGVNGVFSSITEKIAERYMGDEGVVIFDIPAGVTVDTVQIARTEKTEGDYPVSKLRPDETEAINKSDAQIVKLITVDSRGQENQYIVKDPELRKLAYKLEQGPSKGQARSIPAFHGSPYAFEKFTTEKMGTGEGAQAFGWGLYFTGLEDVARWYATTLAGKTQPNQIKPSNFLADGKPLKGYAGYLTEVFQEEGRKVTKDTLLAELNQFLDAYQEGYDKATTQTNKKSALTQINKFKKEIEYLKGIKSLEELKNKNLYKVTIHEGKTPDEYTYLEWDKPVPLSIGQKIENQVLKEYGYNFAKNEEEYEKGSYEVENEDGDIEIKNKYDGIKGQIAKSYYNISGKELYNQLSQSFEEQKLSEEEDLYRDIYDERNVNNDKKASLFLLRAGIDGIKYPAESLAKGATSETARGFNYVVFDENAVTINERVQFRRAGFAGNTNNNTDLFRMGGEKLREFNYDVAEAMKALKEYLVSTGMTEEKAEKRINESNIEQMMQRSALSNAKGGAEALSGIARGLVPQSIIDSVNISRRSTEEMFKRGKELVDNGTIKPEVIVKSIAEGEPRVLSPDEVAALVYYKNQLDNKANKAYEAINEARAKNDAVKEKDAKDEAKAIEQAIIQYEVASIKTAYEQSLAFRLRKLLADASYSLVSMRTKYKALYGTLPEDVARRFDELNKLLKEKEKAEDEWFKEKEAYEEKLAMLRLNDQYEAERTNPKAVSPKVIATLKSWGNIISKPISSIFSKKGKGQARKANDTSDGEVVYRSAVNMVMDYVAEKNDASDKVVNEAIAKAMKAIKDSVWYGTLSADEKIQAEKEFTASIKDNVVEPFAVGKNGLKIPNSVIKYYVAEQGLKDIDDVAAAILRDYKAQLPDGIEVRDIRDAITQYGITLRPSQEEIAKTIRELKQVGMKRSQIEDLKKGLRPLRSGYIADPKSDTVRNLEKEVKQRLKELGVEDVNPEVYLQSALARIKTALGNQIKDLDKEIKAIEDKIAAGEKVEGFKKSVKKIEYDTEALALKEERDALKKVREDLLEQAGVNTQAKIDNAIKALEDSINEYERRLRDKDFSSFRSEEVLPETPELKAAREKRDALRKEYNEQKNALITPAMKEFNKLRELQDKLDDLIQKDAEGFYAAGIATRPQVTESDAVKKLKAEIAAMQQRLGIAASPDDKKLESLRKQLEKVLRGESTTGRGKIQGPDMPAIAQLKQQIQDAKDNMGRTFKEKEDAVIKAKEEAIKKLDREIEQIQRTGQRSPKAQKFNSAAAEALSQVIKGKRQALNEVLKQSGIAEQERLAQAKKNLQRSIEELQRRINEGDFSVNRKPPVDFDEEGKRLQREKRKIKEEYDYLFAKAELAKRDKERIFWDTVAAGWNIPKSFLSGLDMSAPLRQGLPLLMSQLISFPYNFKDKKFSFEEQKKALANMKFMFQASWDVFSGIGSSKEFYENWLADLKESDDYMLMKASKLYIAEESAKLKAGEEMFANNLLHKFPLWERPFTVKGYKIPGLQLASRSERAFNSFINYQRVEAFRQMAEVFRDAGLSEQQNLQDFKALADVINTFTGRASLGDAEQMAEKLNRFLFSARLLVSRFKILTYPLNYGLYKESPKAYFYALEKSAKLIGGLAMILGMAALYFGNDDDDDTSVDLNPLSPSFGTIRLSKYTKVDITAGLAKPISLVSRLAIGRYIKSTTGEPTELKASDYFVIPGQFLYGKSSPMIRLLTSPLMTTVNKEGVRVTQFGETYDPGDAFVDLLAPLILQDMFKIYDKEGAAKTAALMAGAFFGISVSVKGDQYKTVEQIVNDKIKNEDTKELKGKKEKMDIQIKRGDAELLKEFADKYVKDYMPVSEEEITSSALSEKRKQKELEEEPDILKLEFAKGKFGDMTSDKVGASYFPKTPKFTSKELVEAFFLAMSGDTYDPILPGTPKIVAEEDMRRQEEKMAIINKITKEERKVIMEQYDKQALERQNIAKAFNKLNVYDNYGEKINFNTYFPNAAEGTDWYQMYMGYKNNRIVLD